MIRRRSPVPVEEERQRGQLFLFDPPPEPEEPEDLDALFSALNRKFFGGALRARVEWSNRLTACAGTCRPDQGLIRISRPYHRRRPDALELTLAHEMLHLVVRGHGPMFRRLGAPIAAALGATWKEFRYSDRYADLKRYRYVYACPRCGLEYPSKKRKRASCGRCSPGRYEEEFHLVLAESRARPGPVLLGERPAYTP